MPDFRLVVARQMEWDKDIWRKPATLGLAIRTLDQLLADENENPESRAEAARLIKRLNLLGKKPPSA